MTENTAPWTPALEIVLPYVLGGMGMALLLVVAWLIIPKSDVGIADGIKYVETFLRRHRN